MKKKIKYRSRKMNDINFLGNNKINKVRKPTYPKDILEVKVFQNKNNKQFNLPVMKRSTSPRIIKNLLNNKNVVGLKFKIADVIYKNAMGKDAVYKNKLSSPLLRTNNKYNKSKFSKSSSMNVGYNVSKIRKMNWKQLKQKYPMMSPTADADFDGLINMRDCKPLDPSKDGFLSRMLGKVTGEKYGQTAEEYEEEKEYKKEQKYQKAEAKVKTKEEKYIKEAAKQVEEKGYAAPAKVKGVIMKKRLQELRAKIKARAKVMEKEFKPEKTLVGRLVTRIPVRNRKEIKAIKAKRVKGIVKAVERFAGVRASETRVRKTIKGKALDGAGRPKGTYKYRDPRTGEPITAIQYHKLRKQLKRQAKTVETRAEIQHRLALAKRGLSPEEVSVAQEQMQEKMARLRAIKEAKKMEVSEEEIVEEIPQQVRPQYQRVETQGVPPGYRLQDDLMTGKKKLVPLPQPEAWTR